MKRSEKEIAEIKELHLIAFGESEGPMVSELAANLLADPKTISIDVVRDGKRVGNILFSPLTLVDHPDKKCYLLAPIGVLPEYQGDRIGKELIDEGVKQLGAMGVDAIFVLGYPKYYGSRGFAPTWVLPPFHATLTRIDAWKMREIKSGSMAEVGGKSIASDAMMKPMYWDTTRRD